MRGELRPISLQFCDVRGFTALSESMPPEALIAIRAAQARLNAALMAEGLPEVRLGAGVNAGLCDVGLMGGARRLQ